MDAAAGDAAKPVRARELALLTAFLHAGGADLFGATRGQLSLSDANFACCARIEACLHLGARFAFQRIVDRIGVATPDARWVFRSEPNGVVDAWKCAATEAVASIGGQWSAIIEARLGLRCIGLRAGAAVAWNAGARVVGTLAALRWVIRSHFERVAFMAPVAVVVACARILIEVTIGLARRIVLARNAAVEAIFGVVAGAEALAVLRIDFAITVVVEAIAARVDLALARGDGAEVATTACCWITRFAASAEGIVRYRFASVGHGIARIGRASDAVVTQGSGAGHATGGSAEFRTIAE